MFTKAAAPGPFSQPAQHPMYSAWPQAGATVANPPNYTQQNLPGASAVTQQPQFANNSGLLAQPGAAAATQQPQFVDNTGQQPQQASNSDRLGFRRVQGGLRPPGSEAATTQGTYP